MADTAKPVGARRPQCLEHRLDPVAELQIGAADDPRSRSAWAIDPAGAGRGETLDKLDLADRAQFRRPVGAVHRSGFDEDGRPHIVTGADVGDQLVQ